MGNNHLSNRLSDARDPDSHLNSGGDERVVERSGVGAVGARGDSRITSSSLHGGAGAASAEGEHGSDSDHSGHSGHSGPSHHSPSDSEGGGSSAHEHHSSGHN